MDSGHPYGFLIFAFSSYVIATIRLASDPQPNLTRLARFYSEDFQSRSSLAFRCTSVVVPISAHAFGIAIVSECCILFFIFDTSDAFPSATSHVESLVSLSLSLCCVLLRLDAELRSCPSITRSRSYFSSATRCFAPSHPESLAFPHKSSPCTQIGTPASGLNSAQPVASQLSLAMSHIHDLRLFHTGVSRSQHKSLALFKSLASSCVSCSA